MEFPGSFSLSFPAHKDWGQNIKARQPLLAGRMLSLHPEMMKAKVIKFKLCVVSDSGGCLVARRRHDTS